MKILITGGHLTPAVALIEYILQQESAKSHTHEHTELTQVAHTEIVFVGRDFSREETGQKSYEREEMTRLGVRFVPFRSGKIGRPSFLQHIRQAWLFLSGCVQAFAIMGREKPDVFVSFGSYMAVPFAFAAKWYNIPIITHEQTTVVGRANQWIGRLATKVAVSFPTSARFFPKNKVVLTGNPLRQVLFTSPPNPPDWLKTHSLHGSVKKSILYVAGGSQGSQALNTLVADVLPQLLAEYVVIHQCGRGNAPEEARGSSSIKHSFDYVAREHLSVLELSWVYTHASVVVSRSGANTVNECIATHTPAIFVPFPYANSQEQLQNAMTLVEIGASLLIRQEDLTPEHFFTVLHQFAMQKPLLQEKIDAFAKMWIVDGDRRLFQLIRETIGVSRT